MLLALIPLCVMASLPIYTYLNLLHVAEHGRPQSLAEAVMLGNIRDADQLDLFLRVLENSVSQYPTFYLIAVVAAIGLPLLRRRSKP